MDNKSREYEEQHFIETVAFAKVQAESASEKLSVLDKQITQMKSRFNNDNFDLYSQIIVALDKQKGLSDLVNRCNRAVNQPYFGRIDFAEKEKESKTFYMMMCYAVCLSLTGALLLPISIMRLIWGRRLIRVLKIQSPAL